MVMDTTKKVKLTIKASQYQTRGATRASMNSAASGSVYSGGDGSEDESGHDQGSIISSDDGGGEDGEDEYGHRRTRGEARRQQRAKAKRQRATRQLEEPDDFDMHNPDEIEKPYVSQSGRQTKQIKSYIESSDGEQPHGSPTKRATRAAVFSSDDEKPLVRKSSRIQLRQRSTHSISSQNSGRSKSEIQKEERAKRLQRRNKAPPRDPSYEEEDEDADGEVNPEMILDNDAVPTTPEPEPEPAPRRIISNGKDRANQGYSFRKRNPVNYTLPPPLEDTYLAAISKPRPKPKSKPRMNWNLTGAELNRYMGLPQDDSDSDAPGKSPKKRVGAAANGAAAAAGGLYPSGPLPQDLGGGPANFGKITSASALADADPLGVNQNINFDAVGGLDAHIASLKEMTLLPLLYPEVFQRFGVTPPRGVLFHGPPGTGKTLMARALASSCRSDGKSISFFMRKGADCLSKWVGEAERQLRLLFEEARASQPSIIFFDEIDGLAPVRSSKQDQIHASIVSTLLALMDGMDGRGQVIIIGATNRPDAIDSALRRPGRFDREFYFPLPSLPDRQAILRIHTQQWDGWEKDSERGEKMRAKLAAMTKGYGGADLRMLCTEAALNSVQRTYPQIYKSADRLLVQPEKITVQPRDFMNAIKKLVPSSARSVSSTASPLPTQLAPLLAPALEHVKNLVGKLVPASAGKKRDMLEEAEWEWEGDGDENLALERELLMQSMETLRVYRPRLVLCGGSRGGSGVGYVASATLDWLEGFHVQSLDLANLMSDSTRTIEAAIVQLFVEAKRRQPSVVYIPSLTGWCATVSEVSRSTVKAMLDTLAPTDPVLLLAVVDGAFSSLPRDVRQWFGLARDASQVDFQSFQPTSSQRVDFFEDLINNVQKRPVDFPDGWKKRKRVLEKLPIAPPLAPRPPSAAELALQLETDMRTLSVLKYRLGPVVNDLKRKFKVFTKKAHEEYGFNPETGEIDLPQPLETHQEIILEPEAHEVQIVPDDEPIRYHSPPPPPQPEQPEQPAPDVPNPPLPPVKFHSVDLETMHAHLYRDKYLTLDDFMADILKIVHNTELAGLVGRHDPDRSYKAQALLTTAQVHYHDFDPNFRVECEKMAVRERKRRDEARLEREREKEAEKQKEAEQVYAPGTRRSNRANGLAPELGITDIGKIERTLKRARSSEPSSAKGDATDEDNRSSKRSKMSVDQDENPNSDAVDTTRPDIASTPSAQILVPATPTPPPGPDPVEIIASQQTNLGSYTSPAPVSSMSLFSLLNTTDAPVVQSPQPSRGVTIFMTSTQVAESSQSGNLTHPTTLRSPWTPSNLQPLGDQQTPSLDINQPQSLTVDNQEPQETVTPTATLPIVVDEQPPPEPPRPPTPLPDFIIDTSLLSRLRDALVHETSALDVEELEQLRASALDNVWRARSAWDRNPLIYELLELIKQFAQDAIRARDECEREDHMFITN